MDIAHLIHHPEQLNEETLYELRKLVAVSPCFQAARLLFLKNLFLLHDPSFDQELRRAALYLPNRRLLFNMVHAGDYEIQPATHTITPRPTATTVEADRTSSLIDSFLNQTPAQSPQHRVRVDPSADYMTYLLQAREGTPTPTAPTVGHSRTTALIDTFIGQKQERIVLDNNAQGPESLLPLDADSVQPEESCFTETLARIYIKQGRYERALEIITKLNLNNPKKSIYFADQIRFLHKLIVNNKHKS